MDKKETKTISRGERIRQARESALHDVATPREQWNWKKKGSPASKFDDGLFVADSIKLGPLARAMSGRAHFRNRSWDICPHTSGNRNRLINGRFFWSDDWFKEWEQELKNKVRKLDSEIRKSRAEQEDFYDEALLIDVAETLGCLIRTKEIRQQVDCKNEQSFRKIARELISMGFHYGLTVAREESAHLQIRLKAYRGLRREGSKEGGQTTKDRYADKREKAKRLLKEELQKRNVSIKSLSEIPREIRFFVERKAKDENEHISGKTFSRAAADLIIEKGKPTGSK